MLVLHVCECQGHPYLPKSMIISCNNVPHAGKAQLNLTCFDSVAAVEVITPDGDAALNYTDLQGRCITPDWRNEKLMEVLEFNQ